MLRWWQAKSQIVEQNKINICFLSDPLKAALAYQGLTENQQKTL